MRLDKSDFLGTISCQFYLNCTIDTWNKNKNAWLLLLAISSRRIKIDGCWLRCGIGIGHPETILWDPYPLAYRSFLKHLQVGGSSSSLKRKESSTMYLFLRRASTSPSLKPKCGYLFSGDLEIARLSVCDLFLKCTVNHIIQAHVNRVDEKFCEIMCSVGIIFLDIFFYFLWYLK